jgi:SRSO17 transposase
LLEARLYLPKCWFTASYKERREKKCRVPRGITFQTKPAIALELCAALWQSQLFPGQWVTCDASFGNNEAFLAQLPKEMLYLAEIACTRKVWLKQARQHLKLEAEGCTGEHLVEEKDLLQWQARKVAEGERGPIVASFARVRVYLNRERSPESERTLLLRNDPDGHIKYALSNAPEGVAMSEHVRVSVARWPIERCFEEGKSELGLDHYEHRSWPAWHRHMRLVFLAHLFLQRVRLKYKKSPGPDLAASTGLVGVEFGSPEERPHLRPELRPLSPAAQSLCLPIPSQTQT